MGQSPMWPVWSIISGESLIAAATSLLKATISLRKTGISLVSAELMTVLRATAFWVASAFLLSQQSPLCSFSSQVRLGALPPWCRFGSALTARYARRRAAGPDHRCQDHDPAELIPDSCIGGSNGNASVVAVPCHVVSTVPLAAGLHCASPQPGDPSGGEIDLSATPVLPLPSISLL